MLISDSKLAVADTILAPQYESRQYVEAYLKPHMRRFEATAALLQSVAQPDMRVIDVGSYGSLVPVLRDQLGVQDITITQPPDGNLPKSEDHHLPNAQNATPYPVHIDRFNVESAFPYEDESFDLVLFTEVLEHLAYDPMHTLSELNRIMKTGGWLVLTTPNCASSKSVLKILIGRHPNFLPAYNKQRTLDRHNREYTPNEVKELLRITGFEVRTFKTADVYNDIQKLPLQMVNVLLHVGRLCSFGIIRAGNRGDTIFALAKKTSIPSERYPAFLYA